MFLFRCKSFYWSVWYFLLFLEHFAQKCLTRSDIKRFYWTTLLNSGRQYRTPKYARRAIFTTTYCTTVPSPTASYFFLVALFCRCSSLHPQNFDFSQICLLWQVWFSALFRCFLHLYPSVSSFRLFPNFSLCASLHWSRSLCFPSTTSASIFNFFPLLFLTLVSPLWPPPLQTVTVSHWFISTLLFFF